MEPKKTTFTIAGRELTLVLSYLALRLIREKSGVNLLQLDSTDPMAVGTNILSSAATIIWASAQNEANGPEDTWPTLNWVEVNMTVADMTAAAAAIMGLFSKNEKPGKTARRKDAGPVALTAS